MFNLTPQHQSHRLCDYTDQLNDQTAATGLGLISLAIGASAVAPRPIHAISDATIEAERACEGASAGAQSGVSQDDQRDRTDPPLALDACLGHGEIAVLPADARLVASSRPTDAPARGVARPIERPPRR